MNVQAAYVVSEDSKSNLYRKPGRIIGVVFVHTPLADSPGVKPEPTLCYCAEFGDGTRDFIPVGGAFYKVVSEEQLLAMRAKWN